MACEAGVRSVAERQRFGVQSDDADLPSTDAAQRLAVHAGTANGLRTRTTALSEVVHSKSRPVVRCPFGHGHVTHDGQPGPGVSGRQYIAQSS
jgi:hypothetical protein